MHKGMRKRKLPILNAGRSAQLIISYKKAFKILHVRNGRELATMLHERISGIKFTMDFSPIMRSAVACCLLCVFSLSIYHEQSDMRRSRRVRIEIMERVRRL